MPILYNASSTDVAYRTITTNSTLKTLYTTIILRL